MATKKPSPERFEDIDWDEVTASGGISIAPKTKALLGILGALATLFVYDFVFVSETSATFDAVGWGYNVTQLDWLFVLTLVMIAFYGIMPMYENPRMTRYYWNNFKKNRPAMISLAFLIGIFLVGTIGPVFVPKPGISDFQYNPPMFTSVNAAYVFECSGQIIAGKCYGSMAHPLGTTGDGKDILRIVIYGMQVSMKIGLISALLVTIIGSTVGTLAAYAGGLVDEILMRYVDIQQVFPTFLLYLLVTYMFGASLFLFVTLFGLTSWGNTARYVRSNALQKTEEEYIKSARISGADTAYIIRRHLVPNTASSIITDVTLLIPGFILFEASLSFIGLGDPTVPSWGQVIAAGRDSLTFAWWISTIPGFFLFLTILAFNFLGDALLDALNPQADTEAEG